MSKIYKLAIIGCGGIANGKHLPSLKKLDNVEIVAFCDIIEQRAIEAAGLYGTEDARVYTDYTELLTDSSIEIVHVCTPNDSHADIAIAALEAGKHVMSEKPMAKTAYDAQRMVGRCPPYGQEAYRWLQQPLPSGQPAFEEDMRGWRAWRHLLRESACDSPPRGADLGRFP